MVPGDAWNGSHDNPCIDDIESTGGKIFFDLGILESSDTYEIDSSQNLEYYFNATFFGLPTITQSFGNS